MKPDTREKGEHTHQELAEELLKMDPVAQERLKRVGEAAALVASLQAQQAALEKEIAQAAQASSEEARRLESNQAQRASERGAEADVLAAKQALLEAKQELQNATRERDALLASTSQDAERIESAKAGAVAAVGGLLGSLPYLAVQGQSQISTALSAAQVVASCLLFGVTFRYVQSAGASNPQLKAGTVAAFGMVRGLAYADAAQVTASSAGSSPLDAGVLGASALAAGESMLTFAFAAAAVEAAVRTGLLRPVGMVQLSSSEL
ncbi:g10878 [Coccomyxa elongata]